VSNSENGKILDIRSFSANVLIFSFGQTVLLIFGVIQSLIIPKYLSTADYGYWQIFLLFTTYAGILHLGFLDGILVRWAGKNIDDFKNEIATAFRFILLEQGIVVGILLLIIWLVDLPSREIAFAVLVNVVIINLFSFFIFIAQATKRFKLVTVANIGYGLLFLISILILFFSGYFSYVPLILAYTVAGLVVLLLFIFYTRDSLFHYNSTWRSLLQYGKENIGIGLFILLGNFIGMIFMSIDRLTVGSFFPITQFAVYAFAVTMGGLAMVFLRAVSQVFFPYLSESGSETRKKAYILLRPTLVIFWAGILAIYFPFSIAIRYYLPQYIDSLPLIAILLCTVGFSGQIQILHANFFKVHLKQRAYFVIAGISLIGAVALNLLAVFIFGTLTAVAVTEVVSFGLWYLLNEATLRHLVGIPNVEIFRWCFIIIAYISAFLGASALSETWFIGFCIYGVLFAVITSVFLRKEIGQVWSQIIKIKKWKKEGI
jgi:O-antigen/teichoic acid export membrane protein